MLLRCKAAENDPTKTWPGMQLGQQIEAIAIGQSHIGDKHIKWLGNSN